MNDQQTIPGLNLVPVARHLLVEIRNQFSMLLADPGITEDAKARYRMLSRALTGVLRDGPANPRPRLSS